MGCFPSSAASVVVELVARAPAPVLSATPFWRLSVPRPTRACAAGPVGVSSQRSARPCPRPSMSHVIPLRLVQMLNPHRWNCNVFGRSRKVTEGKLRAKYVWRLSGRRLRVPWLGSCLEARPRSPALRPLCLGACRADDGGFAALEASCRRVAGVSRLYCCNSPRLAAPSTWAKLNRSPLTAQFPPFAGCEVTVQGGEVAVQGSMAPKVPTTSATNADNRVLWARQSAFWAQRCLAWCVACTRIPEHAQ